MIRIKINGKCFIILILVLTVIFGLHTFPTFALTQADTFRITYTAQSEKWVTIYKDIIYWLDPQGIMRGYDTKQKKDFVFFENGQPLTDLVSIVSYNGKYILYNRYDNVSYNVSVYDTLKKEDIPITSSIGSQLATDLDGNTIVYIDGGGYGDLYTYEISNEKNTLISHDAAAPKISGRYIVWYISTGSGLYDIRVYDTVKQELITIPNPDDASRYSPDVDGDNVIYVYTKNGVNSVRIFNLNKKEEKVLIESSLYSMSWPVLSQKYVVWGKDTAPHVSGVEGVDLKTGEIFEVQEQGPHQNGNVSPVINSNIVAWMAWRTGNGDIYGSILNH